jgi:hypothetical protein
MKGISLKRKSLLEEVKELDELDKGMRISAVGCDYDVYRWTVIIIMISIITEVNDDDQGKH